MKVTMLECKFIDPDQIKMPDPKDRRAAFVWTAVIDGKRWGRFRDLGVMFDITPREFSTLVADALEEVDRICSMPALIKVPS